MRNGEGIVADEEKRGEIGHDEKFSSNRAGLSLLECLGGWICTSLNQYPVLCFSRQDELGDRGVIVGVSGEKKGGPSGKRTFAVAAMKVADKQVRSAIGVDGEGDDTEVNGELK
jgi:hypothetical protein